VAYLEAFVREEEEEVGEGRTEREEEDRRTDDDDDDDHGGDGDDGDDGDGGDPYRVRETGWSTLVPYKQNRAVIFDSRLLHATDPGFRNRRINLTYLFGKGGSWS